MASGLQRDRGCLYYVPWIALGSLALMIGGMVVWILFTTKAYNSTMDGLNTLNVSVDLLSRPRTALIATATIYLFWITFIAGLLLARSFIEAAHDATGLSGTGSTVWMWLSGIFSVGWWIITIWLTLDLMGTTMWAALLYVMHKTIQTLFSKYGPQPAVVYLASSGQPCPGQCLNLTLFTFISSQLQDSCVCNYTLLGTADNSFNDALTWCVPMLIGVAVVLVAATFIQMNLACAFSHTKREKEYIRRLTYKQFIGI